MMFEIKKDVRVEGKEEREMIGVYCNVMEGRHEPVVSMSGLILTDESDDLEMYGPFLSQFELAYITVSQLKQLNQLLELFLTKKEKAEEVMQEVLREQMGDLIREEDIEAMTKTYPLTGGAYLVKTDNGFTIDVDVNADYSHLQEEYDMLAEEEENCCGCEDCECGLHEEETHYEEEVHHEEEDCEEEEVVARAVAIDPKSLLAHILADAIGVDVSNIKLK